MAEALLREMAGDRFEAFSAGTQPEAEVHPLAVRVMEEARIDIREAVAKDVSRFAGEPFDLVVTVCDQARESCPVLPGARRQEHWGFEDPAAAEGREEERLVVFRRVRDQIQTRLEEWLSETNAG